jgi:parvulin-like peptidyl-prolyl isomerase
MTGSCLSEYKEINLKSMASISELLRRFSNEQQTAMADLKSQTIKLAENQNSINQYYDQRINQLQNTASAIESKVKLFGMMTIVGMLVIGLLIVFL